MAKCQDCGCSTSNGICSNCQEELYIDTYQSEEYDYPPNKDFREKVAEQREYVDRENKLRQSKQYHAK